MLNKTLVSPIALAFGLALTGAAAAQTWVGDQEVSDADLAVVQEHCDRLALAASTAPASEDATAELDEAANNLAGVELTSITLQNCADAGLVEGPFPGISPSLDTGASPEADIGDGEDADDGDDSDNGDDETTN